MLLMLLVGWCVREKVVAMLIILLQKISNDNNITLSLFVVHKRAIMLVVKYASGRGFSDPKDAL